MQKKNIKKILIIKLRGIGDVVLSSIVIKNLKEEFPHSRIDFLTDLPSLKILEPLPFLNNIIIFPRKGLMKRIKLFHQIRSSGYDLLMDLFSNPGTAQLTLFSGAKYRLGFPYKGRKFAYNIYGPSERDRYHAADLHLKCLESINVKTAHTELSIGLLERDKQFADKFMGEHFNSRDLIVGICPSGGWASKKCDPAKFAEIADKVSRRFAAKIIILWGPGDKIEAQEIKRLMKNVAIIAPETDIRELASIISKCTILIANDSGPMHISTAVDTPVLSLHGPTNPLLQGPYGQKHEWIRLDELDCINCNLLECPKKHECFMELPVERVIEKVNKLFLKNHIMVIPENEEN